MAAPVTDREHMTLTVDMEKLVQDRVDELVTQQLKQLVGDEVALAMKKDPAKNTVAIIASKGTLDMAYPAADSGDGRGGAGYGRSSSSSPSTG